MAYANTDRTHHIDRGPLTGPDGENLYPGGGPGTIDLVPQITHQTTITLQGRGVPEEYRISQRTRQRLSDLQPTGYYVSAGETIVIHVSGTVNDRVFASIGVPEIENPTNHPLREGRNEIVSSRSGVLNLINRNNSGSVQITIASDLQKIPFFVLGLTTNAEWERMMSEYSKAPIVQLKSDRVLISVRYRSAQQFLEDPEDLMAYYDRFNRAQDRIAGQIEGNTGIHGTNPNYYHHVEADRLYMFATHGHMGYQGDAALIRLLRTDNGWGPWHETGHQRQQDPWTWGAVVEATVNIYSLAAQKEITGDATWLNNQWPTIRAYLASDNKVYNNQSNETKLGMFWQLHLTFGEDFYPSLHRQYREMNANLLPSNDAQRQQSFILQTSYVSGINLIPFFEMWGFPIEQTTRNELNRLPLLDQPIWEVDYFPTLGFDYTFNHRTQEATVTRYGGTSRNIVIPSSIINNGRTYTVTEIGNSVFMDRMITSIQIPNTIRSIGNYSLFGTELIHVAIPSSVTNIGDYAFSNIRTLKSIDIPNSVTRVGAGAFGNSPLEYITVPTGTVQDMAPLLRNGMLPVANNIPGVTSNTILREGTTPRYQWNGSNNWIPIN